MLDQNFVSKKINSLRIFGIIENGHNSELNLDMDDSLFSKNKFMEQVID